MGEYSFVPSQRRKDKLVFQGFIYRHQRSRGTNHYFTCENEDCPGRAILRGVGTFNAAGGQVETSVRHNHAKEEGREIVLKTTSSLSSSQLSSAAAPSAIVQSHREKVPLKYVQELPSEEAMRQRVRRARRKDFPSEPDSMEGIVIPERLLKTIDSEHADNNEDFLLFAFSRWRWH